MSLGKRPHLSQRLSPGRRLTRCLLLLLFFAFSSDSLAGPALPSEETSALVLRGHQLLRAGAAQESLEVLDRAVKLLSVEGDRQLLLAARINRAHALAQVDRMLESMAEFAASIALADILAPSSGEGAADLGVGVRLQLAEVLAEQSLQADARAAAWDALQAAVRLGRLSSAAPALRMVLLLGSSVDDTDDSLIGLLDEASAELLALDTYRLSERPPPEPIIEVLQASARALASRRDFASARELFELITLLDLARGAHWRLVGDLSDLSWVSLQLGDLHTAHWALQWTEALFEGKRSSELWANWASLQEGSGALGAAEQSCRAAIGQARDEQSPARVLALQARLARLVEKAGGRQEEALGLAQSTVKAYRKAGDESSALAEELRVANQMLSLERGEDAAALLAGVIGSLGAGSTLAADEQVFMHLVSARLSEQRGELLTARSALSAAGSLLFDLGRIDELAALANLFGDMELRSGSSVAAGEAFENAQHFEAQLGLGAEAWQALLGQARTALRSSDVAAARGFLERARERVDWRAPLASHSYASGAWPGASLLSVYEDGEEVYRELAALQLSTGDDAGLLETISAAREFRRVASYSALSLSRKTGVAAQVESNDSRNELRLVRAEIEALRAQSRDEAVQPSSEDPQQAIDKVLEQLVSARQKESTLLSHLRAVDPAVHANLSVSGPTAGALREALAPGEVLLVTYDLDDQMIVFALSLEGKRVFSLPSPQSLVSDLATLWRDFGHRRASPAVRRKLTAVLADLSARTIEPAADLLRGAHTVFWSPDSSLRALPVAALPIDGVELSEHAQIIGLESPRALLHHRAFSEQDRPRRLHLVADPSHPGAPKSRDLRRLGAELRVLKRTGLASGTEASSGRNGLPLAVLPLRLSIRHRLAYLAGSSGPSLTSLRRADQDDPFFRFLAEELADGSGVRESVKRARDKARKRRRDPLGWASALLWFD